MAHVFRVMAERLAEFVGKASWQMLSDPALEAMKGRILDALGCGIAGISGEPILLLRAYVDKVGGTSSSTLIGGGRTSPDRTAFYNGGAIRYLDFNDSYLAPGESCHPSDSLAAVLACVEAAGGGGRELLAALAVAYQVQCRLSDVAPARSRGFDHTAQGTIAAAAGAAKALGLGPAAAARAVAIAVASGVGLRVTRTGDLSHWKGLAAPAAASRAVEAALLAREGITGPPLVFEGKSGFMDVVSGPFEIDWSFEDLERVRRTAVKRYDAEIHSQSVLEAVLELREAEKVVPGDVEHVRIDVFDVAYRIIGGGEAGGKYEIHTKEEADHSLPYLVAVALLDGAVGPEQFTPDRILAPDVQHLLRKVEVRPDEGFSRRFPDEVPCRAEILLGGGRRITREKRDFEGFPTRPASWDAIKSKFMTLTRGRLEPAEREEMAALVHDLERLDRIDNLVALLARARIPALPVPASMASGRR